MISRRDFIKFLGVLGGVILTPLGKLSPFSKADHAPDQAYSGELYSGFVILPYGTKVPDFVEHPKLNAPIFCGVGDGPGITANTISFSSSSEIEVVKSLSFPIYKLSVPPNNLEAMGGCIVKHPTGDIYSINVSYGRKNSTADFMECVISVWAYPTFPRPFPMWLPDPVESNGKDVSLVKSTKLPTPGLMAIGSPGKSFHWIEKNILYRLIIEESSTLEDAQIIINNLIRSN